MKGKGLLLIVGEQGPDFPRPAILTMSELLEESAVRFKVDFTPLVMKDTGRACPPEYKSVLPDRARETAGLEPVVETGGKTDP